MDIMGRVKEKNVFEVKWEKVHDMETFMPKLKITIMANLEAEQDKKALGLLSKEEADLLMALKPFIIENGE